MILHVYVPNYDEIHCFLKKMPLPDVTEQRKVITAWVQLQEYIYIKIKHLPLPKKKKKKKVGKLCEWTLMQTINQMLFAHLCFNVIQLLKWWNLWFGHRTPLQKKNIIGKYFVEQLIMSSYVQGFPQFWTNKYTATKIKTSEKWLLILDQLWKKYKIFNRMGLFKNAVGNTLDI